MIKDTKTSRYDAVMRPKRVQIRAGILAKDGAETHDEKSGLTVGALGTIHEFGLGVPERSFIRAWFDENQAPIVATFRGRFEVAAAGRVTWEQACNQAAQWCRGSIQKRISAGIDPPNAQSTIDRKGSSKPLIATGVLRSAINAEAVLA